MKKVSIAVAVYNEEEHLKRCLDSLINQTYQNIEIILVDDCSTDNSLQICYEYAKSDSRIVVVEKEAHTVLSDVRNVGIDHATGYYIMFVDSDDFVCDNYVEEMVKAIEEKNVDAVRCKGFIQKKDGSFEIEDIGGREDKIFRGEKLKKFCKEISYFSDKTMASYVWTLIIKMDKLNVRFNPQVFCKQDIPFSLQLFLESEVSSIYMLDEPLYYYCYNINGISNNNSNLYKYIDGVTACFREVKSILLRNNLLDKEIERGIRSTVFYMIRHKICTLRDKSFFSLRKVIKYTINKQDIKEMMKNTRISELDFKHKFIIILLKLHFYSIIVAYIKKI